VDRKLEAGNAVEEVACYVNTSPEILAVFNEHVVVIVTDDMQRARSARSWLVRFLERLRGIYEVAECWCLTITIRHLGSGSIDT
jgi:hypothetical protein